MKVTKATDNYLIIDDFLESAEWEMLQCQIECESYSPVLLGDDKVYKLNTGLIYKSQNKYWLSKSPWQNNYQVFAQKLKQLLDDRPSFIPEFKDASMMVHAYTTGSELSWHRDSGVLGGYSFYCHRDWHHLWGGNLLLTNSNSAWDGMRMSEPPHPGTDLKDSFGRLYGAKGVTFDYSKEKEILQNPGVGEFIMPLPNRLVLIDNTIYHKVERVDAAAGMHYRVSLTGFFSESEAKG